MESEKENKEVVPLTKEMKNYIVELFYKDNRKVLKGTCEKILTKIWNDVPYSYRDDFESVAGVTILESLEKYDVNVGENTPNKIIGYVYNSLKFDFISYIYSLNSLKRGGDGNWDPEKRDENGEKVKKSVRVKTVSIYDKIDSDSDITYADTIQCEKDVEDIIFSNKKASKLEACINKLNKTQKKIVSLMIDGYKPNEIQEELQLTNKQYFDYVTDMRTSEFRLALEED